MDISSYITQQGGYRLRATKTASRTGSFLSKSQIVGRVIRGGQGWGDVSKLIPIGNMSIFLTRISLQVSGVAKLFLAGAYYQKKVLRSQVLKRLADFHRISKSLLPK